MLRWLRQSLRKNCLEWFLKAYAWCFAPASRCPPSSPKRIFILRNNDRGDLLTSTPLFEALKKAFPQAEILLGLGSWNLPIVDNNPYVDKVLVVDAPWHNKLLIRPDTHPVFLLLRGFWYSMWSSQVRAIRALAPDIGIDILGSPQGSLLLIQAKIPYRLGVRGYAGGHAACSACLDFDSHLHVSTFALKFLSLLGKETAVLPRPQLYLNGPEKEYAKAQWLGYEASDRLRIVLAPGGGLVEKCWPIAYFQQLIQLIHKHTKACMVLIGSSDEAYLGERLEATCPFVYNAIGQYTMRESFALIEQGSYVICNSSLAMHVAAAFEKPTLVLLGAMFSDAKAHERLWSYPLTHTVLGKQSALSSLPNPCQAWEAFKKILEQA